MDAAPVISRGHNVAVFVPPVPEALAPVIAAASRRPLLILAPNADLAVRLAEHAAAGAFPVTGLERARLRLLSRPPDAVSAAVEDALELLRRSALHPERCGLLVIAWPELLDQEQLAALEAVMAEVDREAQRIIVTARPGREVEDLIERYAFKAMTYGFPPVEAPPGWAPLAPVGPARYVLSHPGRMAETRRRVLDALHPARDEDLLVISCPPTREAAEVAAHQAGAAGPVVVAEPFQLDWLRTLFRPLTPLPLPVASAHERKVASLRERLTRAVESGDLSRELLILGPLLERHDAVELAAAALKLAEGSPSGTPEPAPAPEGVAVYARLWVGIGKKDGVKPGDLVAALANEAKVPAASIGKIDVRDLFTLLELRAENAEQAVRGLTGITLRGRRLVARLDRGPGAAGRPPRRG